jgi:hypothetical protein
MNCILIVSRRQPCGEQPFISSCCKLTSPMCMTAAGMKAASCRKATDRAACCFRRVLAVALLLVGVVLEGLVEKVEATRAVVTPASCRNSTSARAKHIQKPQCGHQDARQAGIADSTAHASVGIQSTDVLPCAALLSGSASRNAENNMTFTHCSRSLGLFSCTSLLHCPPVGPSCWPSC